MEILFSSRVITETLWLSGPPNVSDAAEAWGSPASSVSCGKRVDSCTRPIAIPQDLNLVATERDDRLESSAAKPVNAIYAKLSAQHSFDFSAGHAQVELTDGE